jgi:hypothetical protein
MDVQVGGRHVDDSLHEPRVRARPAGGVPQGLQDFVRLPPVREVVEIDAGEVWFQPPPVLGRPRVESPSAPRIRGVARVEAGKEAIGRERAG